MSMGFISTNILLQNAIIPLMYHYRLKIEYSVKYSQYSFIHDKSLFFLLIFPGRAHLSDFLYPSSVNNLDEEKLFKITTN